MWFFLSVFWPGFWFYVDAFKLRLSWEHSYNKGGILLPNNLWEILSQGRTFVSLHFFFFLSVGWGARHHLDLQKTAVLLSVGFDHFNIYILEDHGGVIKKTKKTKQIFFGSNHLAQHISWRCHSARFMRHHRHNEKLTGAFLFFIMKMGGKNLEYGGKRWYKLYGASPFLTIKISEMHAAVSFKFMDTCHFTFVSIPYPSSKMSWQFITIFWAECSKVNCPRRAECGMQYCQSLGMGCSMG